VREKLVSDVIEEGMDVFEEECAVLSALLDDRMGLLFVGQEVGQLMRLVIVPEQVLFSQCFHVHFILHLIVHLLSFFAI
jgi:hypothetical protein